MPAIDVVCFCDPKNSKIDIVQATGRALRRADHRGKKIGYVVVPIYHRQRDRLEQTIEAGPFKNLISVIRALCSHDERLIDEIRKIKLGLGKREKGVINFSIDATLDLITIQGFEEELKRGLFSQIIETTRLPWRIFFDARLFVHTLNIKNRVEWRNYCKSGEKPEDIPTDPEKAYKNNGWKGIGDWLGTGAVATFDRVYLSFEKARSFIHTLNLKNAKEWQKYCTNGEKPAEIPAAPEVVYKNDGWKGLGDWLGFGVIACQNREYLPFEEAKLFAHTLNLNSFGEWRKFSASSEKPANIPTDPSKVYKNKGWISWGDWLGTGTVSTWNKQYLPFVKARSFVHGLNLKSKNHWFEYFSSGKKTDDIPGDPYAIYKDEGWISWGDWLGTGRVANYYKEYLPFEEARSLVHRLKLKSQKYWFEYCRSSEKPDDIPGVPCGTYKNNGWINWGIG